MVDIEKFTFGLCAEFAFALNSIIHKPIVGLFDDNDIFCHAFIQISDDIGVDAQGRRSIDDIKNDALTYCECNTTLTVKSVDDITTLVPQAQFSHEVVPEAIQLINSNLARYQ